MNTNMFRFFKIEWSRRYDCHGISFRSAGDPWICPNHGNHFVSCQTCSTAVLFNAAEALLVAGVVNTMPEGVEEAAEAIDKGLANALLNCWIAYK